MNKKIILICVAIIIGLFATANYYHSKYKFEKQQKEMFEVKYNSEIQAVKKQQQLNNELTKKYNEAYEKYIKEGNFCYNHIVEDDVLKMLGE